MTDQMTHDVIASGLDLPITGGRIVQLGGNVLAWHYDTARGQFLTVTSEGAALWASYESFETGEYDPIVSAHVSDLSAGAGICSPWAIRTDDYALYLLASCVAWNLNGESDKMATIPRAVEYALEILNMPASVARVEG